MSEREYSCSIRRRKPIKLRSQKYQITFKTMLVENFSIDKRGRKIPGTEIHCVVPTEIVSIKKVK